MWIWMLCTIVMLGAVFGGIEAVFFGFYMAKNVFSKITAEGILFSFIGLIMLTGMVTILRIPDNVVVIVVTFILGIAFSGYIAFMIIANVEKLGEKLNE